MSGITTDLPGELVLQGIGASPGVAVGEVVLCVQDGTAVPDRAVDEQDVVQEVARFEEALSKTRDQIGEIQRKVSEVLGEDHARIFNAHLLVVDDHYFIEEVICGIHAETRNVEAILNQVAGR